MKQLKYLYAVPIILASLIGAGLVYLLLPKYHFAKALLCVFIPLVILSVGFRIITDQRIQKIKNQLFQMLQILENFDVDEPTKVKFEKSPFPIFNELNEYLVELVDRVRTNYIANKQFTQNASHELQTPLAIIKGYVEILLQSPRLAKKDIESLAIIMQNTNRLSKLNTALILLSKIENHRFVDSELVNFKKVLETILKNFKDLIEIQELDISIKIHADFEVEMSPILAEILIANLVQNAIRHNESNFITVEIGKSFLKISNLGKELTTSTKSLFKRFKRQSDKEESLGLGLSIVQRICEQSDLDLKYIHDNGRHTIIISK